MHVRNSARTLPQALSSIIDQSYPNIEIIVIDGGSTDGAIDVLHSFNSAIDVWISEPDDGISDAFNKGIAASNGAVIGILNADDWYEPDAIRKVVLEFARKECTVVCGAQQYWDGAQRGLVFYSDPDNLPLESTVNHATVFVKREVYEEYGLFKPEYRYAMDYDLLLRIYLSGERFCVLPDILANVRQGGRSDSAITPVSHELYEIKMSHIGRPLEQATYSVYHAIRTAISKQLRAWGADDVLIPYRQRYSVAKKSA